MKLKDLQKRKRQYLNHQFNFRISLDQKEHLQSLSDEFGLSTSYIVRTALTDWLNANNNE